MGSVRVLSTKLLPQNLVKKLNQVNIECVQHNFINIEPLELNPSLINIGPNNWIITSQNAWTIIKENIKSEILSKKIFFCVGDKTKQLIEDEGYNVFLVEKNAKTLAKSILSNHSKKSFQYFCGDQRMTYLPILFQKNNIDWFENVIYNTHLTSKKIDEPLNGILFFSPTGIKSYFESNLNHNETFFCIGNTTSLSVDNTYTNEIIIDENHTIESVIDSVIKYYS